MSAVTTRRVVQEQLVETRTTSARSPASPLLDGYPGRNQPVSSEQMNTMLQEVKTEQGKNVVVDTLAALVTDVNATAEILRRGQTPTEEVVKRKDDNLLKGAVKVLPPEPPPVEYRLHLSSPVQAERPPTPKSNKFPSVKRRTPSVEDRVSVERVFQEFGIETPTNDSIKKRSRSETPSSRRLIRIEKSEPPPEGPMCAACGQEIKGACLTALAPNSEFAMKFHPPHFVCTYCQKALSLRGTYREFKRKPYCHECFYRLFSGHIYVPSENIGRV